MAIRPRNPGAWMRGALALAVVVVLGGSAAVSTPPQQRGMVDSTDIPVRPVVTPAARQTRQTAIDDATAATRAAAQARAAAAASAIRVADLDAALTELDLVLARTRMWQPALAELVPAAPVRPTPYPARVPLPATTDPTATDPASTAPATTDPANGDPAAAPHSDATDPANGDAATPEPATTDPATTGLAEGTTPAADSTRTATAPEQATPDDAARDRSAQAQPTPDQAASGPASAASSDDPRPATDDPTPAPTTDPTATTDTTAPDVPVDPEAARVQAATAEVERRTSDVRAATAAAEEAARLAAEEEARRQAEAAAAAEAEAARRAAQAASLDGYRNGEIPADALCAPDFAPGHKLRCDAAEALDALNQAYRDRFGVDIGLTDSYRSYASQVTCVATKGNLCATPGTSNHGWGTAVDLAGPLSRFGTTEHDWLLENARQFGWDLPAWALPTGSKPEPWHWEYTP